jgi:signal transduction histidine kinase
VREAHPELGLWLEPLLQRVSRDGGWAAAEDKLFCVYRHGSVEETYLSATCSRLTDEGEDWCGVLISIDDTTERVVAARRGAALRDVAAGSFEAAGVSESCLRVFDALSRHGEEVPYALLYLRDGDGLVRLAAVAHVMAGTTASPEVIRLVEGGEHTGWPVTDVLVRNETFLIDDVRDRFGVLPAGDWPFAPRCALVLPVTCPGSERPAGVLIAGVSARRAPNAQYRAFVELVAKQIGAVVAGARAHEAAEHHAILRAAARQREARRRARLRALKERFSGVLDERTRLAREIHDTLLHGVTGVALQLRAVLPHLNPTPACEDALQRIVALAERTSHEARQAVWDIRPSERPGANLARVLQAAVRQLVDGSVLRTRLTVSGRARRLSTEQQDVVLRVTQEAVVNVVRHAAAHAIRVRLKYTPRRLIVTVADDGTGFLVADDPHAYTGHWGLVGMHERAESVGGEIRVCSAPGVGTTVRLVVPIGRRTRPAS